METEAMTAHALPAEFQDEIVQIIAELRVAGTIKLLLDYPEKLDAERLSLALRRMIDAEPILGCRFDLKEGKARWIERNDLEAISQCRLLIAEDLEAATQTLISERFDPWHSPNVSAALIRTKDKGDRLLLSISHVIADGAAALDFAAGLTKFYTQLGKNPDYRMEANTASRDSFIWMKNFKTRDRLRLLLEDLKSLPKSFGPKRGLSSDKQSFLADIERLEPGFQILRLNETRVKQLDDYAYEKNVTLNDVFLAAFFKAFDSFCPTPIEAKLEVVMPTNLRRYAPLQRRPAIRNLAGTLKVQIESVAGDSFDATLDKVRQETLRHKRRLLGTEGQISTLLLAKASFASKKKMIQKQIIRDSAKPAPPVLTQIGFTTARQFACDAMDPIDLAVLGEASPLPVFLTTLVKMDDRISLAVCYDQKLGNPRVKAFINRLDQALPY